MGQVFDCAALVPVVADSVEVLRRCDVFRLLQTAAEVGATECYAMQAYIRANRPDLSAEVADCMEDIEV